MKLYTEKQVRQIINRAELNRHLTYGDVLDGIFPIELPSEHEIEESSFKMSGNNVSPSSNFMIGAYWMKEQILNQNK